MACATATTESVVPKVRQTFIAHAWTVPYLHGRHNGAGGCGLQRSARSRQMRNQKRQVAGVQQVEARDAHGENCSRHREEAGVPGCLHAGAPQQRPGAARVHGAPGLAFHIPQGHARVFTGDSCMLEGSQEAMYNANRCACDLRCRKQHLDTSQLMPFRPGQLFMD